MTKRETMNSPSGERTMKNSSCFETEKKKKEPGGAQTPVSFSGRVSNAVAAPSSSDKVLNIDYNFDVSVQGC